jgi:hypothetical protein
VVIFTVTPGGAVTSLVVYPQADLNAIAVAPQSFGSFGGYLIGVTLGGSVIAVHPLTGAIELPAASPVTVPPTL